jgi:hypothetical protein
LPDFNSSQGESNDISLKERPQKASKLMPLHEASAGFSDTSLLPQNYRADHNLQDHTNTNNLRREDDDSRHYKQPTLDYSQHERKMDTSRGEQYDETAHKQPSNMEYHTNRQ